MSTNEYNQQYKLSENSSPVIEAFLQEIYHHAVEAGKNSTELEELMQDNRKVLQLLAKSKKNPKKVIKRLEQINEHIEKNIFWQLLDKFSVVFGLATSLGGLAPKIAVQTFSPPPTNLPRVEYVYQQKDRELESSESDESPNNHLLDIGKVLSERSFEESQPHCQTAQNLQLLIDKIFYTLQKKLALVEQAQVDGICRVRGNKYEISRQGSELTLYHLDALQKSQDKLMIYNMQTKRLTYCNCNLNEQLLLKIEDDFSALLSKGDNETLETDNEIEILME